MDTFKQECKLCDNIINDKSFQVIEDLFDKLQLQLKLTFDNKTQNVMCSMCSSKLFAAINFKSTCLYTNNRILPYVDCEYPKPVDLKDIYLKEKGSEQECKTPNDGEICRLCLQSMGSNHKPIQEVPVEIIQIYIPEINFAISTNPAICSECYDALCVHGSFIRDCLDVERKRKMYATDVEHTLLSDSCIKTEEIEIKSEETDDEPLFEDLCCLKKETNDEKETSHSQLDPTGTEISNSLCDVDDLKQTGAQSALANYKWKEDRTTCESLVADHELRHKRVSQAQVNKSDCSNSKSEGQSSHKNQAKFIRKGLKVQKYQCDKCGFNTRHRPSYVRHYLLHKDPSEVQTYECDKCDHKCLKKGDLFTHQLIHKDPSEVQTYECDKCDYKCIRKKLLNQHQLRHKDPSEVLMYECGECDYTSIHKRSLLTHKLRWHRDPSEVQMYKCDKCDYKCIRKDQVKRHQLRHRDPSEVQTYTCDKCDYKCIRKQQLKRHQLRYKDPSEVPVYKCGECDYKSIQKDQLRRHQLRHIDPSEVPTYACDKCDYNCIRKQQLKQHKLRHKDPLEVQMYKCDECDYKSIQKDNLKIHQLRHKDPSEVQMYECDECDYKSNQKVNLKKHQLRHKDPSEVQMYECGECDYKSKRKGSLLTHQLRHKVPSEVQMYECKECDYKSKHKGNLLTHQLRWHR